MRDYTHVRDAHLMPIRKFHPLFWGVPFYLRDDVQRFQLVMQSGARYGAEGIACDVVAYGAPLSSSVNNGNRVRIAGLRHASGAFYARRIYNCTSGARMRIRLTLPPAAVWAITLGPILALTASQDELASLPAQRAVTILGVDGGWAYVEYQSTRGYVPLDALTAQ